MLYYIIFGRDDIFMAHVPKRIREKNLRVREKLKYLFHTLFLINNNNITVLLIFHYR